MATTRSGSPASTSGTAMPARRGARRALWAILAVALVLRLLFFLAVRDDDLLKVPQFDAADYDAWATRLVHGDWDAGRPYWQAPLYPHFLAVVYLLLGSGPPAPQLVQLALTLLTLLLLYRLALRLTSPPVALLAVAIGALYGPPVLFAGLLMPATLITLVAVACVLQIARAHDAPSGRRWFAAGLLVGVAAVGRGNWLALLPAVYLFTPRGRPWRARLRWSALAVLGAALAVAPVTIRNAVVGHDLVLLTSNTGLNLLIGQQSQYGGIFGPVPGSADLDWDPEGQIAAQGEVGRRLRPSEVSRHFAGRAMKRLAAEPGAMLRHYAVKAYRLFNGYELPQVVSWDAQRARLWPLRLLVVPFAALSALGLLGLLALPPPGRRLLGLTVGIYAVSLLPFFPTDRFRLPIAPLLCIPAAALLRKLWTLARARRPRRLLAWTLPAVALLVVALPRWTRIDPRLVAWQSEMNRAGRAFALADTQAVYASLEAAEKALPSYAGTYATAARYLQQFGRPLLALGAWRQAELLAPRDGRPAYAAGRLLDELGHHDEAVAAFERSARADSTSGRPHYGLAMVYREDGDLERAAAEMRRAVALAPQARQWRNDLAALLAEQGRLGEARQLLRELTARDATYAAAWLNLARVERQLGDTLAATQALERAAACPRLSEEEAGALRELGPPISSTAPPPARGHRRTTSARVTNTADRAIEISACRAAPS